MTKVLYVEHNDDNLYMLKTRLELLGDFQVLTAEDSEKGRNLAVTEHPDVILMDLEMPDADCWEVVRRLKNDAQTGHIPIIGMSAYALTSEREKAIATGVTSSMPNRLSSNLWSLPFGASLRTRNNSPALLIRVARRSASAEHEPTPALRYFVIIRGWST